MEADILVNPEKLHALGVRALMAVGVSEEHARMTADVLLASDFRGIESHGFAHLADFYVGRILEGNVNPKPDIRVVGESPTTVTIDADRSLGFVPAQIGMEKAIEKAREVGIGFATIRRSTHFGPSFYYAMMALPHGMIGWSMTTGGNIVIPPGGSQRTLGSNTISFAAPRREGWPFVLDMATSVVAGGKFEIAHRRGKPTPVGWGLDLDGQPITDGARYLAGGGVLPLGGEPLFGAWKGFGLAIMSDILCGVLSGGGASVTMNRAACHFVGAMRIDAFEPLEDFYDRMDEMIDKLRAAPRLPGEGPLTFAGECESALAAERRREGVPLHPNVIAALKQMCGELNLDFDL
jgi:LDH2 family malate/lactate/ureidoglycolate dehydrogenase